MKQIPNLFTLLNLVFGCFAIILVLQTGETLITVNEGQATITLPEKMYWGGICMGIAAIIDFLDGFIARLFKATSAMGKELDSLADVVSFGVAPGMILYQLLRTSYVQQVNGLDVSIWALAPAIIFPCAAAYRLARFNTETNNLSGFSGVPTPAAGLVVAALPLILWYNYFNINTILLNKWIIYAIILLLSYLMVSRLPLIAFKFRDLSVKNNMPQIILIVISFIAAFVLKWLAVPVIFLAYLILSLITSPKREITSEDEAGRVKIW